MQYLTRINKMPVKLVKARKTLYTVFIGKFGFP